jgi:exodeoxyribonuclease VIII
MVDLETLDQIPTAHILSIGACAFNEDGEILDKFYYVIDAKSCMHRGLSISADTLAWWENQSEEARKVLAEANSPTAVDICMTLALFSEWFKKNNIDYLWCHGASFDEPILSYAYHQCDLEVPWKFWNVRCTRTVFDMFGLKIDRSGTYHNALDDAISQTKTLMKVFDDS